MNEPLLNLYSIEIDAGRGYDLYQIVAANPETAIDYIRNNVAKPFDVVRIDLLCAGVLIAQESSANETADEELFWIAERANATTSRVA